MKTVDGDRVLKETSRLIESDQQMLNGGVMGCVGVEEVRRPAASLAADDGWSARRNEAIHRRLMTRSIAD